MFAAVDEYADLRFDEWRQWRRHLHAHPELSWEEGETTGFIREQLKKFGLHLNPGPRSRGGYVDLGTADPGSRLLALRGDIDAIPVTEANDADYRSTVDGVMHACGHDVHTATVLAVCDTVHHLLQRNLTGNSLNFRAIFQAAEEVAEGAAESVKAGMIDGVHAILAMHVDSSREVGHIGFRDGIQTACCDEIHVTITGPGGHGARPHETADPIFAAAQFINAAYAMVPRIVDARHDTVLSFCHIEGGHSANVIPTDVKIQGTLRSFDGPTRTLLMDRLKRLAFGMGQSLGVDIRFESGVGIPSVNNCPELNKLIVGAAESFLHAESVTVVQQSLGGEDFSCYQKLIPGSLIRIGSARGTHGTAHLHSPHFDVDEDVIKIACRLFVRAILQWCQPGSGPDS